MNKYLLPEDDGLPTRVFGTWTTEKLDYVRRYIYMFETSMRKNHGVRGVTLIYMRARENIAPKRMGKYTWVQLCLHLLRNIPLPIITLRKTIRVI